MYPKMTYQLCLTRTLLAHYGLQPVMNLVGSQSLLRVLSSTAETNAEAAAVARAVPACRKSMPSTLRHATVFLMHLYNWQRAGADPVPL